MDATMTLAAPLGTRLYAWMQERFAPANALLFFTLYLTAAAVARAGTAGGIPLSLHDVIGCLVTWSFFLLLRIFDEHKDYELDCRNHPQRVLQSGLITLAHLKVLGVLAVALQIGWSLWLGAGAGPVLLAWGLLLAWTCLMGKEFFIADWLTRHLTWYAVSHMLVMPLVVWWLAQLAVPGIALTGPLQLLMLLAFVSGFCFEITRKTKGPEEERDSVESYSRIFGTRGAAWVVIGLVTAMVACQVWLIQVIAGALLPWALVLLAAFYALGLRQMHRFLQAPSAAMREKNEAMVALTMLAGYAVLMAVIVAQHGLSARWL